MRPPSLDRTLWPVVAALAGVFALFEVTNLDLWVQDAFYDFTRARWLVDRREPVLRAIFYVGPKFGIGLVALALLVAAIRPPRALAFARRDALVAFLTIAMVPLLIGLGKNTTNVHCPWDLTRYDGDVPYLRVLERFPPDQRPARRGRGFPAGHASGGFALVGLVGLARTRRGQWFGVLAALSVGGAMGVYQMAKGAHFISHTLVSALLAWIVFLLLRRVLRVEHQDAPEQTDQFSSGPPRRGFLRRFEQPRDTTFLPAGRAT